jgi:hypothetical protein
VFYFGVLDSMQNVDFSGNSEHHFDLMTEKGAVTKSLSGCCGCDLSWLFVPEMD